LDLRFLPAPFLGMHPKVENDDDIIIFDRETKSGKRECPETFPGKTELRILLME